MSIITNTSKVPYNIDYSLEAKNKINGTKISLVLYETIDTN